MKKPLLSASILLFCGLGMKALNSTPPYTLGEEALRSIASYTLPVGGNPTCSTTISAPSISCNTTFTLSGTAGGNTGNFVLILGTGTLVDNNDGTASYTPGANEGKAVIRFVNNGEDGCVGGIAVKTATITTTAPAAPVSINGNISVCPGSQNTYSVAVSTGASSYNWTFPSGCSLVSGGSTSITEQFGSTSGNVSITAQNACGTSAATTLSVTVNHVPNAPGSISGSTLLCSNANTGISYSVAPVAGATSYTWTLPAGGNITSGTGTDAITANFGALGGNISVAATNGCGTSAITSTTLVIDTMPANPGVITGIGSVCQGQTGVSYSIAPVTHASSYVWTLPTGATVVGGNNTNVVTVNYAAGASSGNIYASAANAACLSGTSPALLVTVNHLPNIIVNWQTICAGATISLYANGANTYTWSTGATASNISVSPLVTTDYTVTGTDVNGCINTDVAQVTVNPLPHVQINGMTAICTGNTDLLTASGANTYTWNTSATGANIGVNPTVNTNYQVTGTDGNGCVNSATISITVNPLPVVTVTSATVCAGHTATLTASGANSYTWNTGTTGATIIASPTVTTNYTVTGTDGNSCINKAIGSINAPANPAPYICMVSTDTNFINNRIFWDRTLYPIADSFIVYRLSAGVYLKIGAVSKDSNQVTDIHRNIGGPGGGDPKTSGWYYKLAVKDTCGNISPMSPYHFTVNFQQNNQNLTWNAYAIESPQTNPVNNYEVWRDSTGFGDWAIIANVSGLSYNDTHYASYPNSNYRVDATPFTCVANERLVNPNGTFSAKVKSHSNTNNNRGQTTGLKQALVNNIHILIYPNPNNGAFTIKLSDYQNTTVEVYNTIGQKILEQDLQTNLTQLNLSGVNGMYQLRVLKNGALINQTKVLKQE